MDDETLYSTAPAIFFERPSEGCPFQPHDYIFYITSNGVEEGLYGTFRLPNSSEWLEIKEWLTEHFDNDWKIVVYDTPEFVSEDENFETGYMEGEAVATLTPDTGIS